MPLLAAINWHSAGLFLLGIAILLGLCALAYIAGRKLRKMEQDGGEHFYDGK